MGAPPQETETLDPNIGFARALELASDGQRVVVVAESDNGTASPLIDMVPADLGPVNRVVSAFAGRARVGGIAEDLGLDESPGRVLVVEDAQWADPTSLGRLQRLTREAADGLLLILAHRPLSGVDAWWIDRLAAAARQHAALTEITLDPAEPVAPPPDLDPQSIDLIVATGLVTGAISIPAASRLLDRSEPEVLEMADGLVREGWIGQTRGGFVSTEKAAAIDAGEARLGYVAGRLATVLGESGGDPAVVGSLRMSAGQPDQAFPLLAEAAVEAQQHHAAGEAFHLAEAALEAAEEAGVGEEQQLGELHLVCGQFLRSAGRSDWAASHLEKATSLLAGVARVDALGFAAAVADDRQHPQEAERILAVAEWEAARQGETAKLGSLLTFRARALSRIGFADEADAVLGKGVAILEQDSSPVQRFYARLNQAWIHFDRGEASKAEMEFTRLRDEAGSLEGDASVADKEAWRARALFASGHPSDALKATAVAEELAAREDVEAPLFLSQLAMTEGNLAFGRYPEALAAADRVLDLVERQLPAWENIARSHRASALLRLGRLDGARAEITAALESSPPGSDGWRWRTRCRALQMEIAAEAGERWPAQDAEDLADHMLQSRLYGWAAELLCAIAERSKRKEAAREAMALAVQMGNPMLAARAAEAGSLWGDSAAAPVIRAMRSVQAQVPSGWEDQWQALPAVKAALEAPEPAADEGTEATTAALEQALQRAGLAGADVILSPAQRRSRGLVRRPRTIRPLAVAAAAVAVVVIAAGTAFAVAELTRTDPPLPPPVAAATTAPVTTDPLTLEETQINLPANIDFFFGTAPHRGGYDRSGYVEASGPRSVDGFFWRHNTAGPVDASPVAYGRVLLVGSTDGTFYAFDQTTGTRQWTLRTEGGISAAPALGETATEGRAQPLVIVVGDDGVVRAREAILGSTAQIWGTPLRTGVQIRSSPVVTESRVLVATLDGFVFSLDLLTGVVVGTYPDDPEGIGRISADLAYQDGILYVGTEEGVLHVIDVGALEREDEEALICAFDAQGAAIVVNPLVVDDIVYVPTRGQNIWTLAAGTCQPPGGDRLPFYVTESPIEVAPAIVGDVIYLPSGPFLYARDLSSPAFDYVWPPETVRSVLDISAPPVVTEDAVYFGSEDGTVRAVDKETGRELWVWSTGNFVRGSPAVVDGVVFIVSGDGTVYAVGEE